MNRTEEYCYLIRRKADGKKFVAYGNRKKGYIKDLYLYSLIEGTDDWQYKITTLFGLHRNISDDIKYDSKHYSVVYQYANV